MFRELLDTFERNVEVVDIGAGLSPHGISQDIYYSMYANGLCNILGFEASEDELQKRIEAYEDTSRIRFLPYVIGNGEEATFHLTDAPATSSLLMPNLDLLHQFRNMKQGYSIVASERVQTVALDDLNIERVDFVKIDTQGAEGLVIDGGRETLRKALVVYAETMFVEMYKDQALFADIDLKLRELGYNFSNFLRPFSRQMIPMVLNNDEHAAGSQLMYCDGAVWIRDLFSVNNLSDDELAVMATVLHFGFSSFDIAGHMLFHLDRRTNGSWLSRYLTFLSQR